MSDLPWGPTVGPSAVTLLWPSTFPSDRKQETAAGPLFTRSGKHKEIDSSPSPLGFPHLNLAPSQEPLNPATSAIPEWRVVSLKTSIIQCELTAGTREGHGVKLEGNLNDKLV